MKRRETDAGKTIKGAIKRKGYSVSRFSERFGVTYQSFNQTLNKGTMRVDLLLAYCQELGLELVIREKNKPSTSIPIGYKKED